MPGVLLPSYKQFMSKSKTIIIGLDGVPFGLLKDFTENGVMPNTAKLVKGGYFSPMYSSVPEISSVAWSSIITACNPAQHGIFGFMDMQPGTYKMCFPNFSDIKGIPFWKEYDGKFVILNVPSTYPVSPLNGVHISGFVSIDLQKSVYPQSLIPELKELDYRLDVDAQVAHKDIDAFLKDMDKTLESRIKVYEYLWKNIDWRTFMLVFTCTDRLMHFLWDAYEDGNHKYHGYFVEHFKKIDRVVGEVAGNISEEDNLLMLSDHGFEGLQKDIYVNRLLADEGYLHFYPNKRPALENIDSATKAFALDPARIYINLKGKYPNGSVEKGDRESCLKELECLFDKLEIDGKKALKYIFRKEKVYNGPFMDNAPDLILIGAKGFNLKGSMAPGKLADKGIFTGKHSYDDAFFLSNKSDVVPRFEGDRPSVTAAGELIKKLAGNLMR